MRTRVSRFSKQAGSVLVISLVLAIILGTTLASYLYWVRTQNLLVAESQAWNSALAVAEAGIEEGMAQINVNVGNVGSANLLNYTASIAANWGGAGPTYTKNGAMGYSVTVSNDNPPTIYATGTNMIASLGKAINRTVMVKTMTNSLFGVGIAAINNIDSNGKNLGVDAYDSTDTVSFPNGIYNPTNAIAKGDVASAGGNATLGNGKFHGRVFLSPSATYSLGPGGLIGDMPANWPTQNGLQSADWVFYDYNKDFPDVLSPYTSGLGLSGNATNTYNLGSGSYYVDSNGLMLKNNEELYVSGVATLYVVGTFNAKSGSKITIGPAASLKLYVGAATGSAVSLTFDTVNNTFPNNANNLQIFGLPTCTSFTLNGNDTFMGTIYTPEADFTLNGGGSGGTDYQGALVVNSVKMQGNFSVHYDVNLSRIGTPKGYTLASWQEL